MAITATHDDVATLDALITQLTDVRQGVRKLFMDLADPNMIGANASSAATYFGTTARQLLEQINNLGISCTDANDVLLRAAQMEAQDAQILAELPPAAYAQAPQIQEDERGDEEVIISGANATEAIGWLQKEMLSRVSALEGAKGKRSQRSYHPIPTDMDSLEESVYEMAEKHGLDVISFTKDPCSVHTDGELLRICLRLGIVFTVGVSLWVSEMGSDYIEGVHVGSADAITYVDICQGGEKAQLFRSLASLAETSVPPGHGAVSMMEALMAWASRYRDLYAAPCVGCGKRLRLDAATFSLSLPLLRGPGQQEGRSAYGPFHAECA